MNSDVLFSSTLQAAVVAALKSALDNCIINIYAGTPPTNIDAGLSGATLLAQLSKGDASPAADLVWDDTTSPTTLQKPAGDTWSAPTGTGILANGTPSFYVINSNLSDDNSAAVASGNFRIMGLIGPDTSYGMTMGALTAGQPLSLDAFGLFDDQQ